MREYILYRFHVKSVRDMGVLDRQGGLTDFATLKPDWPICIRNSITIYVIFIKVPLFIFDCIACYGCFTLPCFCELSELLRITKLL